MLAGTSLMTSINFSLVLCYVFQECAKLAANKHKEHLGKRHSNTLPSSCHDIAILYC